MPNFLDKNRFETVSQYIQRKTIEENGMPEVVWGIILMMAILFIGLLR